MRIEGRAAADHIMRSPDTTFKPEFLALAAPYMDEARTAAQSIKMAYHGQAKKRHEQELREEFA